MPDEPLVFVHVALVKEIASSMQYIRDETESMDDEHDAKAAIFYSISSTQKGLQVRASRHCFSPCTMDMTQETHWYYMLQGVDLGNFLIKEVAKALKAEHNQLETFATLSPIPQFVPWLETQRNRIDVSFVREADLAKLKSVLSKQASSGEVESASAVGTVLKALHVENWFEDAELEGTLKPILLRLGARYIYQEKKRGKALCPVSNFHIRNGAIFERINWLADPSPKVCSERSAICKVMRDLPHCSLFLASLIGNTRTLGTPSKRGDDGELQIRPQASRSQQRKLFAAEYHPRRRAAQAHPGNLKRERENSSNGYPKCSTERV